MFDISPNAQKRSLSNKENEMIDNGCYGMFKGEHSQNPKSE